MAVRRVLPALAFVCLLIPATSSAQSHWGVMVSGAPQWKVPGFIVDKIATDGATFSAKGSAFLIGFVRGRAQGGDWGVSFVRETVKDGSFYTGNDKDCVSGGGSPQICYNTSTDGVTSKVKMTGVEIHVFLPFATIAHHVQVGINLAGGVAGLSGNINETKHSANVTFNSKGQPTVTPTTTLSTVPAADEILNKVPLGRVGIVLGYIVANNLKVRWEGGMLFPGQCFSQIVGTYLFGK